MTPEEIKQIREIIADEQQKRDAEQHGGLISPTLPPYYQPLPNYQFPYHQHCPCCPCRRCVPYQGPTCEPWKITW